MELHSAAAASVLTGINAKDAICLQLAGRAGKSEDHRSAVPELAGAGPAGKAPNRPSAGSSGSRPPPSTRPAPISRSDATKAVEWATRMVDAARDVTGA